MKFFRIVVSCALLISGAHAMNSGEDSERAVAVAFSPKNLEVIGSFVRTDKSNKQCAFVQRYDANICKSISCFASNAQLCQLVKEEDAQWNSPHFNKEVPGCVRRILYDPTGEQIALVRHEEHGNSVMIRNKTLEYALHKYFCDGEISSLSWEPDYATKLLAFGFAKRTQDGSHYEHGYVALAEDDNMRSFATPSCPYPRICMLPNSTIAVVNGGAIDEKRNTKIYIYNYEGEQLIAIAPPQPCILKALAYCPITQQMLVAGEPLSEGGRAIHVFERLHGNWRTVRSFGTAYAPFVRYDGLKLSVSANGEKVALVNPSEKPNQVGVVNIFKVQTGTFIFSEDAHYLADASLSHDGKQLASASYSGAYVQSLND